MVWGRKGWRVCRNVGVVDTGQGGGRGNKVTGVERSNERVNPGKRLRSGGKVLDMMLHPSE